MIAVVIAPSPRLRKSTRGAAFLGLIIFPLVFVLALVINQHPSNMHNKQQDNKQLTVGLP